MKQFFGGKGAKKSIGIDVGGFAFAQGRSACGGGKERR